jgi:hypothetical protein
VSSLVHMSMRQYAVIKIGTAPHCERLVIAYPDEKTLRDLLAEPSIVALGYSSREEAAASIFRYGAPVRPLWRKPITTLVIYGMQGVKEFVSSRLPTEEKFRLGKTQGAICGLLQQTLVAAVVVFYSRNVLSAALRALISF